MRINCKMHVEIDRGITAAASIAKDYDRLTKANDRSVGFVRMYQLDRPSMILTQHQNIEEMDIAALRADGIPVERRITDGGGALFIGPDDFVLSVAIGKGVFPTSIRGLRVYCMFSTILMNALGHLGVETEKSIETKTPKYRSPACFGMLDKGELVNEDGCKVYGGDHSRRTLNGYFQYGFVPLSDQNFLLDKYSNLRSDPAVPGKALSGHKITFDELAEKFRELMYGEHPEWLP